MNKRLTLQDLADILAEQTGKDMQEVERFLQEFIAVVTEGVYLDKIVKVKGLGTFKIIQVEERESISVNSGERFVIPSHYKFTFVPDKDLRELVNRPFSLFETTELNDAIDFSDMDVTQVASENEKVSEDSVEEVLPEAIPLETMPKEESLPIIQEAEADVPSVQVREKHITWKWRILVTCLVGIICIGVSYIAYLSEWFVLDKQETIAQFSLPEAQEVPEMMGNTPQQSSDTLKVATESLAVETSTDIFSSSAISKPMEDLAITAIKPGDRLTTISLKYYGHKFFWVYIYMYNKSIITDPNNIPIGTEIRIPPPERYGIDAKNRASVEKAAALQSEILSNKE